MIVPAATGVAQDGPESPGVVATPQSVLAFLGTRIARFKLPRRVVMIDTLPKSALGKVQKPILIGWLSDTPDSQNTTHGR